MIMNTLLVITKKGEHVYVPADIWHLLEKKFKEEGIVFENSTELKTWMKDEIVKEEAEIYYKSLKMGR